MKTNQTLRNKSNNRARAARVTAVALGITFCLSNADAFPRGVGAGGRGAGVRPGVGVGGVGAGAARVGGFGVGAPGRLPAGYHYGVPAGYTSVRYAGYACRLAAGVYYRAVTYQGQTVWVVVP